jgi:hypothetical protein
MFYALIVTVIISGSVTESQWKTFENFEQCQEVASTIVRHRDYIVARCVPVERIVVTPSK